MREVRMKSISAGPDGVRLPESIHAIPKEEAHGLVKSGYAEYTTMQPEETADERPSPRRGRPPKGADE